MLILPKCVFAEKNEWLGGLSNYPLTPNVVLPSPDNIIVVRIIIVVAV